MSKTEFGGRYNPYWSALHYKLSQVFLEEFWLPEPKVNLEICSGSRLSDWGDLAEAREHLVEAEAGEQHLNLHPWYSRHQDVPCPKHMFQDHKDALYWCPPSRYPGITQAAAYRYGPSPRPAPHGGIVPISRLTGRIGGKS